MTGHHPAPVPATPTWPGRVLPATCLVAAYATVWLVVMLLAGMLVGGWQPIALTSGSMAPGAARGDVVLIDTDPGQLGAGAVITYRNPAAEGSLVTHRIEAVLADGTYRTKGDANRSADSTPIAPGDVLGQGRMLVPFIALPVAWAVDGDHHLTVLLVAVLLLVVRGIQLPVSSPVSGAAPHRIAALGRGLRAAKKLLAVAVVLVVGGAAPSAFAAPTGTSASFIADTIAVPLGLTASFSCGAATVGMKITIGWDAVTGADGYEIARSTTSGGPYTVIDVIDASSTSYADTAVVKDTTYYYVVRTVDGPWTSADSLEVTATTPSLCLL
jgi:signal peptidase